MTLTWKYADIKVLSTTTTMSLLCSWTRSEQALMSTTFIMGLVGVSIHTNYTKKDRVLYYGNAGVEYTFLAPGQKSISESTQSALSTCANSRPCYAMIFTEPDLNLIGNFQVSSPPGLNQKKHYCFVHTCYRIICQKYS